MGRGRIELPTFRISIVARKLTTTSSERHTTRLSARVGFLFNFCKNLSNNNLIETLVCIVYHERINILS